MSRPIRRVLGALATLTLVSGLAAVQSASANYDQAAEPIAVDGGGCPPGTTLQNIWCATHQRHEQECL